MNEWKRLQIDHTIYYPLNPFTKNRKFRDQNFKTFENIFANDIEESKKCPWSVQITNKQAVFLNCNLHCSTGIKIQGYITWWVIL